MEAETAVEAMACDAISYSKEELQRSHALAWDAKAAEKTRSDEAWMAAAERRRQ